MLNKKINEYTSEELNEIKNQIVEELALRLRKEKEEAWREVVEAMKKFTSKYDDIIFNTHGDTFYIDKHFKWETIGEITQ